MKARYLFLVGTLLTACNFWSCTKETHGDVIYISGTEVSPLSSITAETNKVSSVAITIRASDIAGADIRAELVASPELVEQYNQQEDKNYIPMDAADFELVDPQVTIKAGSNISNAATLRIKSIEKFQPGSSYMVAVTIKNESGSFPVLKSSRTIYYVIKPVVITTVADLRGSGYFIPDFNEENASDLKSISHVTVEGRLFVNNFQNSSPFISSFMGIEEHFLLRFGDVIIKKDQLQLAGMSVLTIPESFSTGTWYHVALVHEPTSNKFYINGVLVASGPGSANINMLQPLGGGAYSTGFLIGSSAGSRYLNGMVSECRFWTRALSQTEIVDGMCGVSPSSEGLRAYWKFNEGSGRVAKDVSGHGHDAVASGSISWVENVRCE
jgi:hypothetical protein